MKNCIFISAGDKERFASFAVKNLIDYDIIINYYGDDKEKENYLKEKSTIFFTEKTTKFISLKKNYELIRDKYKWVAVFDDDAKFVCGSMDELINAGEKYNLIIISGCHVDKISYKLHEVPDKKYKIRFTNFIEMNFPVFKNEYLAKYMDKYDGGLCGWGNDFWYCNVLGSEKEFNMGILDTVIIENPLYNNAISTYMTDTDREKQWKYYKEIYSLEEWKPSQLYK